MGKKTKRVRKTIKVVNVLPKLTLPLLSTKVIGRLREIGKNTEKVFKVAKRAFVKQD